MQSFNYGVTPPMHGWKKDFKKIKSNNVAGAGWALDLEIVGSNPLKLSNVARAGVEPATFRVSVERSYQLSYLATQNRSTSRMKTDLAATPTGLEPATSAVTGRRANQLRYGA